MAEDIAVAAWAGGLVDKGSVPFVPSFARQRYANMPCLYVGGDDDKTGLGVAYASASSLPFASLFLPVLLLILLEPDRVLLTRVALDSSGRRNSCGELHCHG